MFDLASVILGVETQDKEKSNSARNLFTVINKDKHLQGSYFKHVFFLQK